MRARSGRDRLRTFGIAVLVAAGPLIGGCDRAADRDRYEASAVLRALEIVRAAPNEAKRRPADELAQVPCTSPIVCGARDSCADAYQHLARGTEAAMRVKSELDQMEQHPPDAGANEKMTALSNELDRADKEISGAKDGMRKCEEAASLMRRTFGI
jgi:hypothetical protein